MGYEMNKLKRELAMWIIIGFAWLISSIYLAYYSEEKILSITFASMGGFITGMTSIIYYIIGSKGRKRIT